MSSSSHRDRPKRPATYDDLLAVPDHFVAEIVDGELHVSPRPALRHSRAASSLGGILGPAFQFGNGGPGGWWILFEPEIHLRHDVVVPDLAGWRRERMPEIPETVWTDLPPDWLCEILSPSTSRLDRTGKLFVYGREKIPWVWLLDPIAQTLEVLELSDGRWTIAGLHSGSEIVHAPPFEAIPIDLTLLWGGIPGGRVAEPSAADSQTAPLR